MGKDGFLHEESTWKMVGQPGFEPGSTAPKAASIPS